MSKILLSIPDDLLQVLDEHIGKFKYERSEFIRKLIRDEIYPEYIPPKIVSPPVPEVITVPCGQISEKITHKVMVEEVKKDEEAAKQAFIHETREKIEKISKVKEAPMFCPKHRAMRLGDTYTCGCKVRG